MKKILFLIFACFLFTGTFAQKLNFKLNKNSKPIQVFNTINLLIEITNTTNKPIVIFVNSFKEYGGVVKGGFVTVNGKKTKLREWGLDTNSGYRAQNFVTLAPGQSRVLKGQQVSLKEAGDYTVTYSFKQDPATVNSKWGENSKAKQAAKTITKLQAEGSYTFKVAPTETKALVEEDITWEQLQKKKQVSILAEAIADPSTAFKVGVSPDREGRFDVASVAKMGQLKNLRSLRMTIGKEDVTLPADFANIPLMELYLDSKGGKLIFPEGMFQQPTLRRLSIANIANIPVVGKQPYLTYLRFQGVDMVELPDWIADMESLEELSFNSMTVKKIPASFQKLTTLKSFNCYDVGFEVLENLFNNTNLKMISIGKGKIKSISSDIKKLKNCKTLSLMYGELTSIPKEVYQMPRLEELKLGGNQLTQLPDGIEQVKNLSSLVLMKNKLTTLPKGVLKCEKLRFFNGKDNNFAKRDKTMKSLKKKMKGKKYLMN